MKIIILTRNLDNSFGDKEVDTYGRVNISDALGVKKVLDPFHEVKIISLQDNLYQIIRSEKPDLIFNLADDGFYNDPNLEPHVPALLDILKIPYTGNNYFTLALCQNKARAKEIMSFYGILTPKWQVFNNFNRKLNPNLRFPLIVKPVKADGSIGIKERSVVYNEEQLRDQVSHILDIYKQEALVEEYIDGREFNVGLIGNQRVVVLPISEIDFSGLPKNFPKIVSYRAKWVKQSLVFKRTPVICPAVIDEKLANEIREIAKKCYKIFGCRGYARIDFRYSENEKKNYVLEVNPNPDISEDAGLAKAAKVAGLSYQDLILKIVNLALEKN